MRKIEKLALDLLKEIRKEKQQRIERGEIVEVAGHEWIILKVDENKVHCLHKEFLDNKQFDKNSSDWGKSSLRKYLNETFYGNIANEVGKENILPITTDLLSLDGQKEYGTCEDRVSLLTVDMYRESRDILPNTDEWWWLGTPWSTPCNGYETLVCAVSPRGYINVNNCYDDGAVRPFIIFDSSIF